MIQTCTQCGQKIDLSRVAKPGDDFVSRSCGAHGHTFCGMKCADAWEKDPAHVEEIAESIAAWDRTPPEEKRRQLMAFMGYSDEQRSVTPATNKDP